MDAGSRLSTGLAGLDRQLGIAAALGLRLTAGWLVLVLLSSLVAALPGAVGRSGRALRRRVVPATIRYLAEATVGAVLLGSAAGPAIAQSPPPTGPFDRVVTSPTPSPSPSASPTIGPAPAPVVAPLAPAPPVLAPPPAAAELVVRPGDTLWDIAARHLSAPTPARIDATWRQWYRANRPRVGPNPNLIHPGLRLRPPDQQPRSAR